MQPDNLNQEPQPTWFPSEELIRSTNIFKALTELSLDNYLQLHAWSVNNYADYWQWMIKKLNIIFEKPYSAIVDLSQGIEKPNWLVDATLNIVNSCFQANPADPAIIYQNENGSLHTMSYQELLTLTNRIANSISNTFQSGDAIGICMPMTPECVAIYLGIIKAGCTVTSIADSFSAEEIATRLRIANGKGIFTQDVIVRGSKCIPLYDRVKTANAPLAIVLPAEKSLQQPLRNGDLEWSQFLSDQTDYTAILSKAQTRINILFSSGTTGDPKAIPWHPTTAIKVAADAYFHQDVQPGDILAWPTNIGWMMGPWLIFAALLNKATIALYSGLPSGRPFGTFIDAAKVTILGVVPSLVKTWRSTACMEELNWSSIKCFSSTGECSNADDMQYLMQLAGNKPVIEYCGGTEIGGGYVTGTLVQPAAPAAMTTPAMGLDFVILDESGKQSNVGEVALIPPSMGLSTELLNKDHHEVYHEGMPRAEDGKLLRRHGDQIEIFSNGFYRVLGRVDDTMNLGAIKVSSAEIERALVGIPNILETAAIAITPKGGGPSQLIIYAVVLPPLKEKTKETNALHELKMTMQAAINQFLNPLFKIHDVVLIEALPRTASNKVMRRVLRDRYQKQSAQTKSTP